MRTIVLIVLLPMLSACEWLSQKADEFNELQVPVAQAAMIADRFADILVDAAGEDGVLQGYSEWLKLATGIYAVVKEVSDDG
jgi:hypothetical protein